MLVLHLLAGCILLLILPRLGRNWLLHLLILTLHLLLLLLLSRWLWLSLICCSNCCRFLQLVLLLLASRLRVRVAVRILLPFVESFVLSVGMALEVPHVLIDIDSFLAVLLELVQETFDNLSELGEILLDESLILLVLTFDVDKELFEMVRIIHDQLIDDSLVEINTRELVGITLNDDCSHSCEMSRH